MSGFLAKSEREKIEQLRSENDSKASFLAMVQDPNRWPGWPTLPMTKLAPGVIKIDREVGFIIENPERKHTVFKGNIFMMPKDISTLPMEKFESFESMYEAGWMVD